MLSKEEIQRRKDLLREDAEAQKICAMLGVSMDRFLDDIEQQWEHCELHDALDDNRRAITIDEVATAAEEAFREAHMDLDTRLGHSDIMCNAGLDRERSMRTLLGDDDF